MKKQKLISKLKIWHISDTHEHHDMLEIPQNIDVVIFSGDCSNTKHPTLNATEVSSFIQWFSNLPIKYKIFVAGNHDVSIEKGLITENDFFIENIIYLENEFVEIKGFKIWGSPYTPTYGNWSFMKARHKINQIWEQIPEDTDIVITHGPPKGILDLSYSYDNKLEYCGCSSLKTHLINRVKPKLTLFGHIHNNKDIINQGIFTLNSDMFFSNGSVVKDGEFGKLSNNGNIIEIIKYG